MIHFLRIIIITVAFQLFFTTSFSQKSLLVKVSALYNQHSLVLDSIKYLLPNSSDSVLFSVLKFYISSIKLYKNNTIVYAEKKSYHLIDFAKPTTQQISLLIHKKISYNKIVFNLGIDSLTNSKGALSGDLDATKAMYWAWNSGYINFKCEGKSAVCKTRNNQFQFHLGGFLYGFNACQKITLSTTTNNDIDINFDIFNFFKNIHLSQENEVMTPNQQTVELSKILSNCFGIKFQ